MSGSTCNTHWGGGGGSLTVPTLAVDDQSSRSTIPAAASAAGGVSALRKVSSRSTAAFCTSRGDCGAAITRSRGAEGVPDGGLAVWGSGGATSPTAPIAPYRSLSLPIAPYRQKSHVYRCLVTPEPRAIQELIDHGFTIADRTQRNGSGGIGHGSDATSIVLQLKRCRRAG